ncbi:MAG TPA: hypothetical protein VFA94_07645 [Acidimicrobiales bacterium]|nr:hypothetical protein [Acidimicrobiales bacterium]
MKKVILHQRYVRGRAWDVSGNGNHGVLTDVVPGTGVFDGSLSFNLNRSRIDTLPSATLGEMGGFRFSLTCNWIPVRDHRGTTQPGQGRLLPVMLAEGDASFRLHIGPRPGDTTALDAFVYAEILDAGGAWRGVEHAMTAGGSNGWRRFDMGHDGIATCWLALDGHVVAQSSGVPGPVRPLGSRGLVVGHQAAAQDDLTLRGHVSEAWLWIDKPDPPVNDCCGDSGAVAEVESLLRQKGWDLAKVKSVQRGMVDLVSQWRRHFPDPVGHSLDQTSRSLHQSLQQQQWTDFGNLARQVLHTSQQYVSQDDCNAMGAQMMGLLGDDVLFDPELYQALFRGFLCHPPPGGGKGDDGGKGEGGEGGGKGGRRPWGADASVPEPDLDYDPPPNPEGAP